MSEEQKFELTSEFKLNIDGIKCFRIKALVDGKFYKKGELGGYVESLELKSGNARVYGDAYVSGNARVYGNACVSGNARVYGNACVYGKIKLKSILCSKFNFEFDWQVKLWQKKEKEFEVEVNKKR